MGSEAMDLTFRTDKGKFNFRVGAILIRDGKVLMVKNARASYYYSVGGRVKYNETCDEAIVREVKEELGVDLEIDYPAFFASELKALHRELKHITEVNNRRV